MIGYLVHRSHIVNVATDIRCSETIVVIRRTSPEVGCVLRIGDKVTVIIFLCRLLHFNKNVIYLVYP